MTSILDIKQKKATFSWHKYHTWHKYRWV